MTKISSKPKQIKKNKMKLDLKPKVKLTTLRKTNKSSSLSSLINSQKEITKPDTKIINKLNTFVDILNKELKLKKINAVASIGGSVAKGTFIKDNFDADIFVKFDKTYKGKSISDILGNLLKSMNITANRVHGSRDYFQIKKEFTYELVPVLFVKDYREAENVADMSPLHVNYFMKKSKAIKNVRDEIRITKQFMKSARVYGAESYIKGFSGHVVDLLLIKYKTFLDLMKAASKWKEELVIDIEKHHIDPKMSLNTSKISGPLIIVDPIQKNRNAAAALSTECFSRFQERCKDFLKNPTDTFFQIPNFSNIIDDKILKTKNASVFLLNIAPLEGKRDVIGSKVLKIKEHIEQEAANNNFILLWSDWDFNENNSRICFAFDDKVLESTKLIKGPPVIMPESVALFKKSHKKTFLKSDYIFAEEKRKFVNSINLLEQTIKDAYVLEKCKSISIVQVLK